MLIVRWLAYILFEILLGFITFGGTLLISYTMFLFIKKRRCIHDFIGKSAVIDSENSMIFESEKEESFYINRARSKGVYHG